MKPLNKSLQIRHLNVCLGREETAKEILREINLTVSAGELISIVGESGCGKSTLLRTIAGIHPDFKGDILFGGERLRLESSSFGFMFQTAKLFDWLTAAENIAYGLKINKKPKAEIDARVACLLEDIGLKDYADYYPKELSGGMQQRISLARSLIMEPELILMDEPFSALDFKTRREMQNLTARLWEKYKPSIVFVTHDIDEAVLLSDRVVVMDKDPGRIVEIVEIPFQRPRDVSLTARIEFAEIKGHILQLFLD